MFLRQNKNTFKLTALITLYITLFQFFYYFSPEESYNNLRNSEKNIVLTIVSDEIQSPANTENNIKKVERSGTNEITDYKVYHFDKNLSSNTAVVSQKLNLLYSINIEDHINFLMLLSNNIDLRSPPFLTA